MLNLYVAEQTGVSPLNYLLHSFSGVNLKVKKTGKDPLKKIKIPPPPAKVIMQPVKKELPHLEKKETPVIQKPVSKDKIQRKVPEKVMAEKKAPEVIKKETETKKLSEEIVVEQTAQTPPMPVEQEVIVEKEDADEQAEEDIYKVLTSLEFSDLLKDFPLKSYIENLSIKTSAPLRKKTFKEMFFLPKEQIKETLPFLRAEDKILVLNIANLLGLFNVEDSLDGLIARYNYEQDELVKNKLLKIIGMIDSEKADEFSTNVFLSSSSVEIMSSAVENIYENPSLEVVEKARELIRETEEVHLKAFLFLLLAEKDKDKAMDFSKTWLATHDNKLDLTCLSILALSESKEDWEYIDKYKRSFFKSVEQMEAFFKTKACILTSHLEGGEKLDNMEKIFSTNKSLLAWLSIYAAKKNNAESKSWLEKFALRHDLFEYPEFIHSMYLSDLPLPDIQKVRENEKKAKEEKTAPPSEQQTPVETLPVGKLKFLKVINGMNVTIDKKEINLDAAGIADEVEAGQHRIKVKLGSGSSNVLPVKVKVDDTVILSIEKRDIPDKMENSENILFKFIPKGEFVMGSEKLGLKRHKVKITKNIWVSVYEITNEKYERFDPYHKVNRDKRSKDDNQPVVMVSWYHAIKFCNWLSSKEKLLPAYDENSIFRPKANGYRLLTEAEWEYCARGGFGEKIYPWGDEERKNDMFFANYYPRGGKDLDGYNFTAPVGSFYENGFGLYDMAGNVSEWCNDWYDESYYNSFSIELPAVNPLGPSRGSLMVTRGASWQTRDGIENAYRSGAHPSDKSNYRGFRISRNVGKLSEYELKLEK